MGDLIKRDDATDAAMKAACDWVNGDTANPDEGVSFAIQAAITALPAVNPAAIREVALREAALKIQSHITELKHEQRDVALNLAVYGRDAVLALIGETK